MGINPQFMTTIHLKAPNDDHPIGQRVLGKIVSGNHGFTIKLIGFSGFNFPMIQCYEFRICPTCSPAKIGPTIYVANCHANCLLLFSRTNVESLPDRNLAKDKAITATLQLTHR